MAGSFVIGMLIYAIKLSLQVSLLLTVLQTVWSAYGQSLIRHAVKTLLDLILHGIQTDAVHSVATSLFASGEARMLHEEINLGQFFRNGNMSLQNHLPHISTATQPVHEHTEHWSSDYADIFRTIMPLALPVIWRSLRKALM